MALPTKAQYEALLDTVAAQYGAAREGLLDGARTPVHGDLFSQVDAVGNPDVEAFLLREMHRYDVGLRDLRTVAPILAARYGPILGQLQLQVADDGTLAPPTLDHALSAVGAQVSPLLQELAPEIQALGALLSPGNVWAPALAPARPSVMLAGAEGSLADVTQSASFPAFALNGDTLYLGFDAKPTGALGGTTEHLSLALQTAASSDVGLGIDYWNGTAWVALEHTDAATSGPYALQGTAGLTHSGVVAFTLPANWARTNRDPDGLLLLSNDRTPRFYLRLERTAASVNTAPTVSGVRVGIGLGLVMVKPDSSAQFVPGQGIDSARYDAANLLKLRALTPLAQSATVTLQYTRRDGTPNRTAAQSAWSAHAAGAAFPTSASSFLALESALEGVQAVTGATLVTTATAGAFAIESVPPRTAAK